jgi:hypothetical protein
MQTTPARNPPPPNQPKKKKFGKIFLLHTLPRFRKRAQELSQTNFLFQKNIDTSNDNRKPSIDDKLDATNPFFLDETLSFVLLISRRKNVPQSLHILAV